MPDHEAPYSTIYVPPVDQDGEESRSQSTKSEQATAHFDSGNESSEPVALPNGSQPTGLQPAAVGTQPVSTKARYRMDRVLGTGSFGVVSLAWDELVQRPVAIKRPLHKLSEAAQQSFLHEARLAAKVRHPGIVTVFDVGVEPTGEPYIVYEYLEGENLKQHWSGKLPPLKDLVSLGIALAEALSAAHQQGLTHRDLKPANILIDKLGRPHIVDFGLAIHDGDQQARRGEIAGTMRYMAPEQLRGDTHLLDGRTDLWALGVILYELLTGNAPFSSTKRDDTLHLILSREPRPPRQWLPDLPKGLENVLLKLLRKPLTERYCSASDVVIDLQSVLADLERGQPEPATVRPADRPSSWMAASAAYIALAVVTSLCCLIAVIALSLNLSGRPTPQVPIPHERPQPFQPGELPVGNWLTVLTPERGPGEIFFSKDATRNWNSLGHLSVQSRYPAMLELGDVQAKNYTLELQLKPSDWTGHMGLFLGYGVAKPTDKASATLLTVIENPPGKVRAVIKRFELEKGGEQFPRLIQQARAGSALQDKPPNGEVTIMAEVIEGNLAKIYLQHRETELPEPLPSDDYPVQGKFGLYLLGGTATFQQCRIRITP